MYSDKEIAEMMGTLDDIGFREFSCSIINESSYHGIRKKGFTIAPPYYYDRLISGRTATKIVSFSPEVKNTKMYTEDILRYLSDPSKPLEIKEEDTENGGYKIYGRDRDDPALWAQKSETLRDYLYHVVKYNISKALLDINIELLFMEITIRLTIDGYDEIKISETYGCMEKVMEEYKKGPYV